MSRDFVLIMTPHGIAVLESSYYVYRANLPDAMQHPRREMYPIFEEWDTSQDEESLMMTTKDFVDCPDIEEEYMEDFPYGSYDEDDDEIFIESDDEFMDARKPYRSNNGPSWVTHSYPPPPQTRPPRLSNLPRKDHRSPPAGGNSDATPSPSYTKFGSPGKAHSGSPSHKISPPTITSTSPCPSSSSESCTTPTNELGERGSPSGASSSSINNGLSLPIKNGSCKRISYSQPVDGNSSVVEAGILHSPQLKRSSKFSLGKQGSRSKSLLSFPARSQNKQSFLQKISPSVESRIMMFGGGIKHQQHIKYKSGLMTEKEKYVSLQEKSTINEQLKTEEQKSPSSDERKKSLHTIEFSGKKDTPEDTNQNQSSLSESFSSFDIQLRPSQETKDTEQLPPLAENHTDFSPLEQQQRVDQISPTSSMEELSQINHPNEERPRIRPEAVVPPHKHSAQVPPFSINHSLSHHPLAFSTQARHQQQVIQHNTYVAPPTQPMASSYPLSFTMTPKTSYSVEQQDQQLLVLKGTSNVQQQQQQQQQPLDIVTTNLAHNAAANGDVVLLHKLISDAEVDPLSRDEYGSTLLHTAATYGQLSALQLLSKDLSSSVLHLADNNFLTPPLLAIQGGHLECLKWFIEEQGIPLTVPDAGGETLIHHAAFHGQVKCLEYLLHRANKSGESVSYTDESGVTPAHFAAQRGHLDCLRLFINRGFDVTLPDHENMKPSDWADAMGQHSCTQYLLMFELCWQLSRDVSRLTQQVETLRQEKEQLLEVLNIKNKEHQSTIVKLHQQHQATIHKVHEKYAGITVSALLRGNNKETSTSTGPSIAALPATSSQTPNKGPSPVHKSSGTGSSLVKTGGGKTAEGKEKKKVKIIPEPLTIEEIPSGSPHEVLQRQLSNVEERLIASREMRKLHPVMATRSFSPFSPILKRMTSQENELEREVEKLNNEAAAGMKNIANVKDPGEKEKRSGSRVTFSSTPEYFTDSGTKSGTQHFNVSGESVHHHHLSSHTQSHGLQSLPQGNAPDSSRYSHHQSSHSPQSPPHGNVTDSSRYSHHQPSHSPPQGSSTDSSRYSHHQPSHSPQSPPHGNVTDSSRYSHHQTSQSPSHVSDTQRHSVHKSPQHKSQLPVMKGGSPSHYGHHHHHTQHSSQYGRPKERSDSALNAALPSSFTPSHVSQYRVKDISNKTTTDLPPQPGSQSIGLSKSHTYTKLQQPPTTLYHPSSSVTPHRTYGGGIKEGGGHHPLNVASHASPQHNIRHSPKKSL